ncbi:MAG: phosphotransferase [Rhizobacter sp.]|nr:phosphotransferase [Rhizobacter sp.]
MTSTTSPSSVHWVDGPRQQAFDAWLDSIAPQHNLAPASLRNASSDASFRRYLRIDAADGRSLIVMDAPPPHEDVRPFIAVAAMFEGAGLNAPRVLQQHPEQGFLLLTDLGNKNYLPALQDLLASGEQSKADSLMRDAIAALVQWQSRAPATALPPYDDALLRRELGLFPEWCLGRECGKAWSADEHLQWLQACDLLAASALAQATVAVHRDYMPRNLMVCEPNPGILDFQDAVNGPISYDVASLLRDAFLSWDEEVEIDWAIRYWEAARKVSLPVPADFGDFWRALEWMGLQRHLKVLGIFCRLKHRDGKAGYADDLPRFFNYSHKVASRYNTLRPLARLLEPLMGAQRADVYF